MKNIVRSITAAILFSTIHMTSASAGPYNQYQNALDQHNVDTYTWLYGEAVKGNELQFLKNTSIPDNGMSN